MSRRRPTGSLEDLMPDDREMWAKETWRDREDVAKLHSGAWMLREAAGILGLPKEAVDKLLSDSG